MLKRSLAGGLIGLTLCAPASAWDDWEFQAGGRDSGGAWFSMHLVEDQSYGLIASVQPDEKGVACSFVYIMVRNGHGEVAGKPRLLTRYEGLPQALAECRSEIEEQTGFEKET